MGSAAGPGSFPRRNRLISGLSIGVVVVEAPVRSGSLITARYACEQNRQVYVVPGSIFSGRNAGSHALVRDGAVLVRGVDDIFAELNQWGMHLTPPDPGTGRRKCKILAQSSRARGEMVLDHLGGDPVSVDALAASTGLMAGDLLAILLELELCGRVLQYPGQRYVRVTQRAEDSSRSREIFSF